MRDFERGCQGCGGSYKECNGTANALRRFQNWDDLAAHCDEETIVGWVNELAERRTERVRAAAGSDIGPGVPGDF